MISRLTTLAATFAVLATASLAYATGSHQAASVAPASAAKQVRVVQLQTVVITAKRVVATPI
jgi:hypothetical protein